MQGQWTKWTKWTKWTEWTEWTNWARHATSITTVGAQGTQVYIHATLKDKAEAVSCVTPGVTPTDSTEGNSKGLFGIMRTNSSKSSPKKTPATTDITANDCRGESDIEMVPRGGIEPPTRGFSVREASVAKPIDSTTCEGHESYAPPYAPLHDTKHAQLKELLAGLSKEEIIALLTETL